MKKSSLPLIGGLLFLILFSLVGLYLVLGPDSGGGDRHSRSNAAGNEVAHTDRPETRGSGPTNREKQPASTDGGEGSAAETDHRTPPAETTGVETVKAAIGGVVVDSDNDPMEGVTVTLLREDFTSLAGETAVSGEDGVFAFVDVPVAEGKAYFVACLEEQYALTASESFTVRKEEPVEGLSVQVFGAAVIRGKVVDAAHFEPLEGVEIKLGSRGDGKLERLGAILGRAYPVKSNVHGEYSVAHLAPGKFDVRAVKEGWTALDINPLTRDLQMVELAEYSNVELLDFVLIQGGVVEGYVKQKSDSAPLPGVAVELGTVFGGAFDIQFTDEQGFYRFPAAPPSMMAGQPGMGGGPGRGGGIQVRAIAYGYAIASVGVAPKSGETVKARDLLLDSGCTVKGRVVDKSGAGVAGAQVYFNDNDMLAGGEMVVGVKLPKRSIATTTAEDGSFTLSSIPAGSRTVYASASGFSNNSAQFAADPQAEAEVTIQLFPAAVIAGVVTNEWGEPVEGVPIAAYEADGPDMLKMIMNGLFGEELPDRGESGIVGSSIRTDAEGAYRIEGLQGKEKYIVVANSRSYEKHVSPEIDVKAGQETIYNFQLVTGGTVYGRVYDGQEQAVVGAAVTCVRIGDMESMTVRTAYTDRNGFYEVTGLPEGNYNVRRNDGQFTTLMMPNPATTVKVVRGERTRFDIYEQRPGTARIYGVVTRDGQPYEDKGLVLAGGGMRGMAAQNATTDQKGNYEFRNVPLGTYQIAEQAGRMPFPTLLRKTIRVDEAGDIEFNIDFVTVSVSGKVQVEGGGLPEGRVTVMANPVSASGDDKSGGEFDEVSPVEEMIFTQDRANEETGEFKLDGLSPGYYRITVRSENYGMAVLAYVNCTRSLTGLVIDLPTEFANLHGIVKGLDEAKGTGPMGLIGAIVIEDETGARVNLGGRGGAIDLNDSKEFDIDRLAPGQYTITLSVTGYAASTVKGVMLATNETTNVEFFFEDSGNAKVIIENDDLSVDTAYELTYEIRDSNGEIYEKKFTFLDFFNQDGTVAQNDDENAFTIKDLPPDTYTITFEHPDYEKVSRTFTIVAGETTDVPVLFVKKE